jgi:EAL domain-containing protein (putative c-di-GMP-specific phosphodiesterase class I)
MGNASFLDKIPSLEELMPELCRRLETEGKLALVSIDTRNLLELEESLDRSMYDSVVYAVRASLRDLCGYEIRKNDLVACNLSGGKKYYIFLSRAREKWQAEIGDLENVALRVQEFLYNRLFRIFFPLFERGPRIRTGYGMSFHSLKTNPKSLVQSLVDESERVALYLEHKIGLMRRLALHDVILNRKVLVRFQPVVFLDSFRVLGYEAAAGGPGETFLGTACNLANFAREAGYARELSGLCLEEALAKVRGLDRDALVFLRVPPEGGLDGQREAADFSRLIERHGLDPRRLVIELPLRPVPADAEAAARLAARFERAQFLAEIDETWTAPDLPLLGGSPFRFVMAGRDLLFRALDDDNAAPVREFPAALVASVRRAGQTLIASGVMSGEEAAAAAALGAAAGQGPYFARAPEERGGLDVANEDLRDRFLQKKLLLSIYLKRGRDYFHQGDFDKAVLEFSKVIEIDPLNIESHYYRGRAFCADGVVGMAVKDYLKLKELDPDFPNLWLLEGLIAEKKDDGERALRAYQEYLERAAQSFDSEISFAQGRIKKLREEA